jgi:hypothetical protein
MGSAVRHQRMSTRQILKDIGPYSTAIRTYAIALRQYLMLARQIPIGTRRWPVAEGLIKSSTPHCSDDQRQWDISSHGFGGGFHDEAGPEGR